jgi:hypothetical protein
MHMTALRRPLRLAVRLVAAVACCGLGTGLAHAQASKFAPGKVHVVDARAAFAPALKTSLVTGERLPLPMGASPEARQLFQHGFQVRIFRLDGPGQLPRDLRFFDPCLVFFGVVFPYAGSNAVEASVPSFDQSWLAVDANGTVQPGYFLLVVERDGNRDPLFRLDKARLKEYFNAGFHFEVRPGRPMTAAEIATEQQESREYLRQVMTRADLNRPDITCFRLEARGSDREELLAYLQPPCSPEVDVGAAQ